MTAEHKKRKEHRKMSTTNESKTSAFVDEVLPLLSYLKENEDKLRILLCGNEPSKILAYPIKGKRSTKTVFISEKLQFLLNEFCIENELKISNVVENAIVAFFIQHDCEEKLALILQNPISPSKSKGK